MKTWKIAAIAALAVVVLTVTVATAYAYCWWGPRTQTSYNAYTGTTAPTTQIPAPVTQTNTQTPTLYTPQFATSGYGYSRGWGGCMERWSNGPLGYPTTGTTETPLTINQAAEIAKTYVSSLNNPDLAVTEIE